MLTHEQRSEIARKGWSDERRAAHRASFNPHISTGRPKGSKNKRPYPVEARQFKSEQTKTHWQEHGHSWTGKTHSEETKQKQSQSRYKFFDEGGQLKGSHKGLFRPTHPEKYKGDVRNIIYRSTWELKFFRYCDSTPGVVRWSSEETIIRYTSPLDGQVHRYFPDVWMEVKTTSGIKTTLVEIKPARETRPPTTRRRTRKLLNETATFAKNQAKWKAAEKYCAERGWQFMILTEEHLFPKKNASR